MINNQDLRQEAVFVVETLRSGVPTRLSTRKLPDLRLELLDVIKDDLVKFGAGDQVSGRMVWGEYGQGKSHLLTQIEHLALDMGFGVSFVSLSREVSCHNLFQFYRRVAPVLRTPNNRVPGLYNHLMKRKADALLKTPIQQLDRYMSRVPAVILECLLSGVVDDDFHSLYNALVGERLDYHSLKRLARDLGKLDLLEGVKALKQGEARALFGLWADAMKLCGLKGWVILIDEIELVSRLGKVGRLNAYLNLNWLLNWSNSIAYPIYTVVASASSLKNDLWFGGSEKRPDDRDIIPEMAKERLGALESRAVKNFFKMAISTDCPTMTPIKPDDIKIVLEEVAKLHNSAYDWKLDNLDGFVQRVVEVLRGNQTIRRYIRGALEWLDHKYIRGEDPHLEIVAQSEYNTHEDEAFYSADEKDAEHAQSDRDPKIRQMQRLAEKVLEEKEST